ncbi:HCNGP-like protein-domain-containing protein [Nemania sp. FL0916]|nr:HCNGP-like protein-domain-containing protein [Nemania sp. FL0916]
MAGLVAYESSDEEEEVKSEAAAPEPLRKTEAVKADANSTPGTSIQGPPKAPQPEPQQQELDTDERPAVYGPQIGPSSAPTFPPLEVEEDPASAEGVAPSRAGSPYTAMRALLRDLTLPAVPDMSIPPSPPGSPPPATSRKFENFLELKKRGVHFNARLADTPSMKNPALADKLLAFAGLDHRDQYRTTLPSELLCGPDAFPRQAYCEQLRQSQSEIAQSRARPAGEPVKFVSADSVSAAAAAGDGKPTQAPSAGKRKTRFDT